ncbi:dipeptidase [Pseudotenacibaculum haliotis]|uniref:Dipeptidase n=1 Tax=Pseudotenacibaculum haliotis TaxID=1862138 RepID=A0ABW5LPS0_9FLAO
MKAFKILLLFVLIASCAKEKTNENNPMEYSDEVLKKAKEIHEKVIKLDTHVDINVNNFTAEKNYNQKLSTQVNLPFMDEGDLDVAWLIVYTGQGELNEEGYAKAYKNAISKFDAIHRLVNELAPDRIGLATSSKEVKEIDSKGKRVAMIGIENGYPVGTDVSRVKEFYDRGARYMSLSHNGHSQLCDSNTGEKDSIWLHNGVSELGKEVIKEMNKWGMMIDVSHPSKKSMKDMIELSKAPIIASHSSARALCNHSRNLDDEQLEWLKENGGVVQTVAFSSYLKTDKHNAYRKALGEEMKIVAKEEGFEIKPWGEVRKMKDEEISEYIAKRREVSKKAAESVKSKAQPVDVADFVDHIDYLVEKIGIDHVGISSDFDGGGGIYGWDDASETLNVTAELVKRGYTEKQIAQLWSGNLLRVLDEVENIAKKIQSEETSTE